MAADGDRALFGLRISLAGILATLAMGAGTAALNAIAIFGGNAIGRMSALETRLGLAAAPGISGAALRIAGGLIIIVLTLGFGL
ncbi:hypothetical protein M2324_003688 [Rhodovulum sulfidophilum]|nr:hypothetical protein [Rhodovulum sulfidophilum]ANB33311.1 hypothetical protein A6W98_04025 [Rhodovulum sulfidophilum DSM 1374]ANB37160.1 hypothetical protein A6024_04015 [Rhodovulum sulfidophilum]MCW2305267.1 hypothetical protein [Rhodovulum sulfidophilum]